MSTFDTKHLSLDIRVSFQNLQRSNMRSRTRMIVLPKHRPPIRRRKNPPVAKRSESSTSLSDTASSASSSTCVLPVWRSFSVVVRREEEDGSE